MTNTEPVVIRRRGSRQQRNVVPVYSGNVIIIPKRGCLSMKANMMRIIIVSFLLIILIPNFSFAETKTFIKEYNYQASEVDSKLTSRSVALAQVKRLLLEELGTYLISESTVKNFELTKDQVSSLTAGVVMTVIIDEKWDGKTYYLKAKITTDTDDLVKSIDNVRKNHEQNKSLEEVRAKTEEALKRIETLRKEMEAGKGSKAGEEKYTKAVNELSSIDWFRKGLALKNIEKNNAEAMKAFDKAIEVDRENAKAYAGRAAIYNDWGQHQKALKESELAIKHDPKLAWGYNNLGWAHIRLSHHQLAIENFNRALELDSKYARAYVNRSWAYFNMKEYNKALDDANKAIDLAPGLAQGYLRKGRALASLGDVKNALNNLNKAIELDPDFSWAFLHRGHVLLKNGETQPAMEDFKKAAKLGNEEARAFLRKKGVQW
ncbi:MAG: hypothetical protein CVU54_01035 [Deltaproteobacteria bacterium HGW-Deltaproteobacteria-12]|jgi:tetratricopeptide (TPR) repeat protein|nr:MAG: hypothetical protein CVU54_01035 [Deltaproteobacteria bacterium HGW-Deltaproteobacteria-12]